MSEKKNLRTEKMEQNMEHALEVWLANPMLSFVDIASKAGISEQTFYRYRQDENFMGEYDKRCKAHFKSLQAKAIESMEMLMEQGHFQASKYVLDGNDYGAKQKIEITTPTVIKVSVVEEEEEANTAADTSNI